jgi:chromosome segregation ATPase
MNKAIQTLEAQLAEVQIDIKSKDSQIAECRRQIAVKKTSLLALNKEQVELCTAIDKLKRAR